MKDRKHRALRRKLKVIDSAFPLARHLSEEKIAEFIAELTAALADERNKEVETEKVEPDLPDPEDDEDGEAGALHGPPAIAGHPARR